ncbi:MAG TPA: periplasmic heavy metal sensor [Stellaceae bacterium]|nr:periplasmic heavy metal sensor [Stellaceae bacterium]
MTTAAAGMSPTRRWSRPRLIVALLAVSVALNLCFVAGAAWTRLKPPAIVTTSERFHRLAQSLDLSPQQQGVFDQYVADMLARSNRVRLATEPLMDEAWAEITRPDPDQARVLQLLDDFSTERREVWHEAIGATLSLLATLTPEQKAKFLAAERDWRMAGRRHRAAESR